MSLLDVLNWALSVAKKNDQLQSFDDLDPIAQSYKHMADMAVRKLLSSYPWHSCTKTVRLLPSKYDGIRHDYILPVDCVSIVHMQGMQGERKGFIHSGIIRSSSSEPITLKYVSSDIEVEDWPGLMVQALCRALVYDLISSNTSVNAALVNLYRTEALESERAAKDAELKHHTPISFNPTLISR